MLQLMPNYNSPIKPIEEICTHKKPLRLEWHGAVYQQTGDPLSCVLECIFTPIDDASRKYLYKEQVCVKLAIGYLPILNVGQRFEEGKIVALQEWQLEEKSEDRTISIDLQRFPTAGTTLESMTPQLDWPPVTPSKLHSGEKSGIKLLNAFVHEKEASNLHGKKTVLIPELEIIRYFLCTSTYLTQIIFSGGLCCSEWRNIICNENHEKAYLDTASKRARIVYRSQFSIVDLPVISRILFDTSNLALQAAQSVFKSRQKQTVDAGSFSVGTHPTTLFPTNGYLNLTLRGRWKKAVHNGRTDYVFLAERIMKCNSPFPFKYLSHVNELHAGSGGATDDAPTAFDGAYKPNNKIIVDEGLSRTKERPKANFKEQIAVTSTRHFSEFDSVITVQERLRDCTHQGSKSKQEPEARPPVNLSTGSKTYGHSTSGKLNLIDESKIADRPSIDLEQFEKILNHILRLQASWRLNAVPFNKDSSHSKYGELPLVRCEHKKGIFRKFSYMDDAKRMRRKFLCIEIEVPMYGFFYLFEMERRETKAKNGPVDYKEKPPIALVHGKTYQTLSPADFRMFLTQTVIHKTWYADPHALPMTKHEIKHAKVGSTLESVAERIISCIQAQSSSR